jgi:alpha-1,3-glucosyltransferase
MSKRRQRRLETARDAHASSNPKQKKGFSDPPKYGDYEAQRHWMEIALGLPLRQWYDESPQALALLDQQQGQGRHWPLDYPPLSGYQSWLTGLIVRAVEPAAVALGTQSRGYESPTSKVAMRLTVLLCDAAVFFPAAFWAAAALSGGGGKENHNRRRRSAILAVLLLNPALVLVDHGHFQYNCISLGLALAAMAALVVQDRREEGEEGSHGGAATVPPPPLVLFSAVLFTLALCHKQMTLYYAPAFFAHMLGAYCLKNRRGSSSSLSSALVNVAALCLVVAATLAATLLPVVWAHREGVVGGVLAVLSRIFPLRRGLYEDYVANFWCATSVGPLKWRELLPGATAARAALAATVLAALPAMAERVLLRSGRQQPSPAAFLLCCANSAAAFFLFSFQVHEKSVLLPLMPATLLLFAGATTTTTTRTTKLLLRAIAVWGPVVGCFGMFPLLERDGVAAAYAACIVAYVVVVGGMVDDALREEEDQPPPRASAVAAAAVAGALALHALRLLYDPPARLPWLHDRLFVTYAFVFIALATAYLNWVQWGADAWSLWGYGRGRGRSSSSSPGKRAAAAAARGRSSRGVGRVGSEESEEEEDKAATAATTTPRRSLRQRGGGGGGGR